MKHDLKHVFPLFDLHGTFGRAAPYGSGHINDTYAVEVDQAGAPVRYIFQRINHSIFKEPEKLMDNIGRVTAHVAGKLREHPEASRRALTLVPARSGAPYARDKQDLFWRCYLFIERARTYDAVESTNQAREAARAFGRFQQQLNDLPGSPLHETIPDFHHTPKRFAALLDAISSDPVNRAGTAGKEIDFMLQREQDCFVLMNLLKAGAIPQRVTHNDTKLNNVMLDDDTGKGVCVIDLDTVMPGAALYDFGDMVRTTTSRSKEDERDLTQVNMRMPMFTALVQGYLESAGGFLNQVEIEHLPFSGKLITLETGLRFLTDYLLGDTYFKTSRPDQNLDRCRTQCQLVRSIEEQEDAMRREVNAAQSSLRERMPV